MYKYDINNLQSANVDRIEKKKQWLVTFSDLMALLLAFFALLLASNDFNQTDLKRMISNVSNTFVNSKSVIEKPLQKTLINKTSNTNNIIYLSNFINRFIQRNDMRAYAQVAMNAENINIMLDGRFFNADTTEGQNNLQNFFHQIEPLLYNLRNQISVLMFYDKSKKTVNLEKKLAYLHKIIVLLNSSGYDKNIGAYVKGSSSNIPENQSKTFSIVINGLNYHLDG